MTRARNLGGIAATTYISADGGNIGIGTTIPTSKLQVVGNVNVSGVTTLGNTVVGGGTTQLIVRGDARVTGILTVGQSSITLDGSDNRVNVGTGVTLHHTNGVQVGGNTVHSTGLTANQVNVSGVVTTSSAIVGSAVTINSTGIDASPGTIKGGTGCVTGTLTSGNVTVPGTTTTGTGCVTGTLTAGNANIPGTVTGGVLCATSCISAGSANIPGTITAGGFSGPGSGLTNIPSGAISGGLSSPVVTDVFCGSGTWTKPTTAKWVYFESINGGDGGRSGACQPTSYTGCTFGGIGGCGGAGGAYSSGLMLADSLSPTVPVTVGSGGNGGSGCLTAGCSGGTSSFGSPACPGTGINGYKCFGGVPGCSGGCGGCVSGGWSLVPGGFSNYYNYSFIITYACSCAGIPSPLATPPISPGAGGNGAAGCPGGSPTQLGGGGGGGYSGSVSSSPGCAQYVPYGGFPKTSTITSSGTGYPGGNGGLGSGGGGGGFSFGNPGCPGGSGGNGKVIVYSW